MDFLAGYGSGSDEEQEEDLAEVGAFASSGMVATAEIVKISTQAFGMTPNIYVVIPA